MTHTRIALCTIAAAAALALTGCGSGDATGQASAPPVSSATPAPAAAQDPAAGRALAPRRVEIAFRGGAVQGGLQEIDVPLGTPVRIVITSDVADEGHLHGYDKEIELAPGVSGTISFTADTPGVFDLELHGSDAKLARLEVR